MKLLFATVFLSILVISSYARAEYIEPIGDGTTYGCSLRGTIVEVALGIQAELTKKQARRLKQQLQTGRNKRDANKKKLARQIGMCLRLKLTYSKPCEAVDLSTESNDLKTKMIDGRICSEDGTGIVELEDSQGRKCSGTLVSQLIIVTAAHCLTDGPDQDFPPTQIRQNATLATLSDQYGFSGNYFSKTRDDEYDIGYVILGAPISDGGSLPVLPSTDSVQVGEVAVALGYGQDENGVTGFLHAGFYTITEVDEIGFKAEFRGLPGQSGLCLGDSGGPLLVQRSGRWVLAGVNSNITSQNNCQAPSDLYFASVRYSSKRCFLFDSTCSFSNLLDSETCPFECLE